MSLLSFSFQKIAIAVTYCAGMVLPLFAVAEPVAAARHALVIGNADYRNEKMVLANPVNDARLIAGKLRQLGFEVVLQTNLGLSRMTQVINDFAERLPQGATAVLYYAGHGVQIGKENYLVPVDEALTNEQSAKLRTYPLRRALEKLATAPSAVNILILDACRDNPFRPEDSVRYRSLGLMGLARVQAPRGTVIAYSTQPGQLAADGSGRNSIYTEALASAMLVPGLTVEEMLKRVNTLVRNKTKDDQIPWYESSLTEELFLIPPAGVTQLAGRSLRNDEPASTVAKRGGTPEATPPLKLWYRDMSDYDWQKLDWDIAQRVRYLNPGEIPALEQQAKGGNVIAQTTLGLAYLEGVRSKRDPRTGRKTRTGVDENKALRWLKMGSKADFPIAQTLLAEMYFEARGVTRDLKEAIRLAERAARANYPRAKLDLAQFRAVASGQPDPSAYMDAMGSALRSLLPPTNGQQLAPAN